MACYGWSPKFVDFGITSAQGWAAYAWALQNTMTMEGPLKVLKGLGYVGQERERLMKEERNETNLNG